MVGRIRKEKLSHIKSYERIIFLSSVRFPFKQINVVKINSGEIHHSKNRNEIKI